jgi:murein DD-endopeptidase MepM/ murein hydrolase activator NlpD
MSSDAALFPQNNDLFSQLPVEYGYDDWDDEEPYYETAVYSHHNYGNGATYSINPAVVIVVLAVIVGVVLVSVAGRLEHGKSPKVQEASGETAVTTTTTTTQPKQADINFSTDTLAFVAPYKDYQITQGIHGLSYGHMAVDIAAGRGEPILAPINGKITEVYIDEYGNTTLVIENEVYEVMFLHGDFTVSIGDKLKIGQQIGTEGNNGYTMDMAGNLCYNREWCGNHTHLNVFDKRIQANINPLDLIRN